MGFNSGFKGLIYLQEIRNVQVITTIFAGENINIVDHALLLGKTTDLPEEF